MARAQDCKSSGGVRPTGVRPAGLADSGPGGTPVHLASLDLGSNTFHLLVARLDQGEPRPVERLKFRVGLAAGLREDGSLDPKRFERACDAMRRIADRIGGIPRSHVRAVGTSTLRSLADPAPFLAAAEQILGVPVRIVGGEEEARLVFAGAMDTLPETRSPRLVIDIGGGSTELAQGCEREPDVCASIPLGCVPVSRIALDVASPRAGMQQALAFARRVCGDSVLNPFTATGAEAIGTSGTIESLRDVLRARGEAPEALTLKALAEVFEVLAAAPLLPVSLPGLAADREEVFPGGVAIMLALWERLGCERLKFTEGALEDGLIRELVPLPEEGLRARTLAALQARFVVDPWHAEELAAVASELFDRTAEDFGLTAADGELLGAAAAVHDIGLAVAAEHHERHGAWLLRNAELRGFTADERLILIALVRGHRGPWPELAINALEAPQRAVCSRLCVLLRLAVILKRAATAPLPALAAGSAGLELHLGAAWRDEHPFLTEALEREAAALAAVPRAPRLLISRA